MAAPPGDATRPITDRIKETLFNVLGARLATPGTLPAVDVLDLFAGSGGLGIEALSRGARSCLFVERGRAALRVLRANIATVRAGDACRVAPENAWTLRLPEAPAGGGYGLVFVDPPFRDVDNPQRVIDLLERVAMRLADDALVVFRLDARTRFPTSDLRLLTCGETHEWGRNRVLCLSPRCD